MRHKSDWSVFGERKRDLQQRSQALNPLRSRSQRAHATSRSIEAMESEKRSLQERLRNSEQRLSESMAMQLLAERQLREQRQRERQAESELQEWQDYESDLLEAAQTLSRELGY